MIHQKSTGYYNVWRKGEKVRSPCQRLSVLLKLIRIKIQREVKTDRKHACHHKHSGVLWLDGWLVVTMMTVASGTLVTAFFQHDKSYKNPESSILTVNDKCGKPHCHQMWFYIFLSTIAVVRTGGLFSAVNSSCVFSTTFSPKILN